MEVLLEVLLAHLEALQAFQVAVQVHLIEVHLLVIVLLLTVVVIIHHQQLLLVTEDQLQLHTTEDLLLIQTSTTDLDITNQEVIDLGQLSFSRFLEVIDIDQ